jgi:hypothetical protein
MRSLRAISLLALLMASPSAPAQEWGSIKGRVVLDGDKAPPAIALAITKDQQHCLSKGAILSDNWVVNPKNLGLRNVAVWIAVDQDGKANHKGALPIHPELEKIPSDRKRVVMDQPCCKFVPNMVILRKGQDFVGKNSSPIAHSMLIQAGPIKQPVSTAVPPGGELVLAAEKWTPYHLPARVACAIHPWMQAYVLVLAHPYFAVTDEDGNFEIKNVPAGKLRLMGWYEPVGYVILDEGKSGSQGKGISVESGKTLDIGKVLVKRPPEQK